jgi:hypothetical protein
MAQIRLRRYETEREYLPEVCMACGQASCTHIRKGFSWYPPWVGVTILAGVLPFAIIATILTKRMSVEVPVCERHRGYWWKRYLLMFLPLVLIVAVGIGLFAAASAARNKDLPGMVCGGSFVVGLVWLIVAAVIQSMMIRPAEITDRSITLKNVHDDFIDALDGLRRSQKEFDDDEYERPRRRRYRDDDEDYRRPPPRQADDGGPRDAYRARSEDISPPPRRRDDDERR